MSGFGDDLAQHLAAYERDEAAEAYWDAFDPDWRDAELEPEDRDLISEGDVLDQPTNLARTA